MRNFFDTDKPVWKFFTKIFCMVELNILWLVCSLPIVTFGASTIALYYTMSKVVGGDDYGLVKIFIRSFKENLKQGIIMGLITLALGALVGFDLYFYVIAPGKLVSIMQVFQIFLVLLYLMVFTWLFPVMAKLENTNIKLIQEIMGHADISTTMNIYNESNVERKKASFARLESTTDFTTNNREVM